MILVRPIWGKRIHVSEDAVPYRTKCGIGLPIGRTTFYKPDGAAFAVKVGMYRLCKRCRIEYCTLLTKAEGQG